jgi:hypothetical protein
VNQATYTLNIGLHVQGEDNGLAARNERMCLAMGLLHARVKADIVRLIRMPIQYVTKEDGLVIDFNTEVPLTRLHEYMELLSAVLQQDCVALRENNLAEGWLLGQRAHLLGAFDDSRFERALEPSEA